MTFSTTVHRNAASVTMIYIQIRQDTGPNPAGSGFLIKKSSRSGSGILNEHFGYISESLETIFGVKILLCGCGSGNFFDPGSESQDGKNSYPRSGINIPDPQQ
jgi:hypothetical protein